MRVLLLTQGHTPNVGDEAIYLSDFLKSKSS